MTVGKSPVVDCVLDAKALLGEAAMWNVDERVLYWADIDACGLHRFDPSTGETEQWSFAEQIGCFAFRKVGGLVVAFRSGFAFFNPATGELEPLLDPEPDQPENRFNDGTPDPAGRFIAGTMPLGERRPVASLYRLWDETRFDTIATGLTVSNGCAFSPDGKTFYFSDSDPSVQTIWSAAYDIDSGHVTNRCVFAQTQGLAGRPDGGTIDSDGCYWMAGVGGWQLVRFTPEGQVDRVIEMPVEKPTKIAFGGPTLDTMFVTSIGVGLTPGTESRQPQAGGVFALRVPGVQGLPTYRFAS